MTRPAASDHETTVPAGAWRAVAVLTLVATMNVIDRYLPAVLAEPIKHEFLLSDTVIGLINGFGFLVLYAIAGIPIARMADRGHQRGVIATCLTLWGAMTLLGSFAHNAWQLALTRMGVAVGESGSTPAAHAYISRAFPPNRRATPLALLTMSIPVAGTLALLGGGVLAQAIGWRSTFLVMGLASLVVVPFVHVALRPRPGGQATPTLAATSRGEALCLLRKPSFLLIVTGTACIAIAGYSLVSFAPAFLARQHGMGLAEVGLKYGIASGVIGVVSILITGFLADRLSSRNPNWLLWIVALMIALLVPFSFAGLFVGNGNLAILFIAINYSIGCAYMAPSVAALQRIAPVELRATASALMLFVTALLGGTGPLLTGVISDALEPQLGRAALGYGLLVVPAAQAIAAFLFLAASFRFSRDSAPEAHTSAPERMTEALAGAPS